MHFVVRLLSVDFRAGKSLFSRYFFGGIVGSNPTTPTILPALELRSFAGLRDLRPRFSLAAVWRLAPADRVPRARVGGADRRVGRRCPWCAGLGVVRGLVFRRARLLPRAVP